MNEKLQTTDRPGLVKRFIHSLRPIINKIPPEYKDVDRRSGASGTVGYGIDVFHSPGVEFGIVTPTTFDEPSKEPPKYHYPGQVTARNLVFKRGLGDK